MAHAITASAKTEEKVREETDFTLGRTAALSLSEITLFIDFS
jgi:hypothetical protein